MRISSEHMERMRKQIALDYNLAEAIKVKENIYLAPAAVLKGSRVVDKMSPFYRAMVFMGTAYVMADEQILDRVQDLLKDWPAEWLFNYGRIRSVDRILNEYNHEIVDTHIYFLPDEEAKYMQIPKDYIWYDQNDIEKMKEGNQFTAALCYSPTQPDVIAVAAPVNGTINSPEDRINQNNLKGMAGASQDGMYCKQIGINVLPQYRGEGLAVKLVTALKQRIIEQGDLPFYGTNESHAVSRTVGIKSGFLPAFAEVVCRENT